MKHVTILACALGLMTAVGCNGGDNAVYTTEERMSRGLVVILPGIEGEGPMNHDIRRGLLSGGVDCALPIYNWGRPVPGVGMLLNQMDFLGNRLAGVRIAKMIEQYQDDHPGEPVYIVGHSGGGGVAVFAAEGLSEGRQVDGLILLSASIWAGYDLTKALGRCRNGIVNFYNESDVGLLAIGTTITSNVDGMRGPSAGLIGFDKGKNNKSGVYAKLYQVQMTPGMTGGDDPHAAATRPGFVSRHVAPWISAGTWPALSRDAHQNAPPSDSASLAAAKDSRRRAP